ncbi:MAG: hypothetical protein E7309_06865 [Butyrivibrio sp.]|jgi:hypothetical protein|nr:hypothetical protein [Butyrivibrio sp.]
MIEKLRIPYSCISCENEKVLFISFEDGGIYSVNPITGEIILAADFGKDLAIPEQFAGIFHVEDRILLLPRKGNVALLLSDKLELIKEIVFPDYCMNDEMEKGPLFFTAIYKNGYIYFFGYAFKGILKYTIDEDEFYCIDLLIDNNEIVFSELDGFFHLSYYSDSETVIFPFTNANAVLKFDFSADTYTVYKVGDEGNRYISISKNKNYYFLIPRDASCKGIVRWNEDDGSFEEYSDYPTNFAYHPFSFLNSFTVGDKVLVLSHCGNMNIEVSLDGGMRQIDDLYDTEGIKSTKYGAHYFNGNEVVFLTAIGLLYWNIKDSTFKFVPYVFSDEIVRITEERKEKRELLNKFSFYEKRAVIGENAIYDLKSFVKYVEMI